MNVVFSLANKKLKAFLLDIKNGSVWKEAAMLRFCSRSERWWFSPLEDGTSENRD